MFKISIDKESLSQLGTETFQGSMHIVDTPSKIRQAIAHLRKFKLVGFDTETRPSFKKGVMHKVALIQISTIDDCFLFRVNKTGLSMELNEFIEDPEITKIGLSIKDDFGMLHKSIETHPQGFVDLQTVVPKYHIADASLQKIYAILFGLRISKAQRLSNWENTELTLAQMSYASIDAWACLKIYNYLASNKFNPNESPYLIKEADNEEV